MCIRDRYLNEDSVEFSNEYRAREVIEKYCSFMPVEIYLSKETKEPELETIDAEDIKETDTVVERFTEDAKTREEEKEDGTKEVIEISYKKAVVSEKYLSALQEGILMDSVSKNIPFNLRFIS